MRIANSNITMASARRYTERGGGYSRDERSASVQNDIFSQIAAQAGEERDTTEPDVSLTSLRARSDSADSGKANGVTETDSGTGDLKSELVAIRDSLLQELLQRMLKSGLFGGTGGTFGGFGQVMGFGGISGTGGLGGFDLTGLAGMGLSSGGLTFTQMNYAEEETTAFFAQGMAQTEDGRTIDFDVNLLLSRSFMQYTQFSVPRLTDVLFDPLVINTGSAIANLSDQTFRFDLDLDGEADNIAMPESGSGFLALDLNEDGVINDGSELFGVKSGNGFADLSAYDSDGNGWIDENDDVFSKLKVWYRNGDGTDELVDLKTADVGAIFLGSQETDFAMYGSAFQLNGMMRATGLFLRESGSVGTIQHIDLAKQESAQDASGTRAGSGLQDLNESEPGSDALMSGWPQGVGGALVIHTGQQAGQTGQANNAEQIQKTETAARDDEARVDEKESASAKRAERAKQRAEAFEKRRAEREALDKAAAERLQKRKELRREQLEALFEDREAQREQYDELLANRKEEHDALHAELLNAERVDEMVEEQMEAVA